MASNPVGWFEIYVHDMARARKFYEGVLGKPLERLPSDEIEMWAFPMAEGGAGAAGALVRMDGLEPGGTGTIFYFVCEDCSVEESRVPQHGGRVFRSKSPIGEWGFISLFTDTEGNTVGLHSMK